MANLPRSNLCISSQSLRLIRDDMLWTKDGPQHLTASSRKVTPQRRQRYADELAALCGISDETLLQALASVPREHFLPPGPWLIESADGSCYHSQDDNPDRIL